MQASPTMFTILGADGKEYGPVTAGKIAEWIAGGRANLQTQARRDGETEWKTLGDFPEFGLRPSSGPDQPPTVAPAASLTVSTPSAPLASMELASRWVRLGARLLDSIVGCIFITPGFVILMMAGVFATPDNPNPALLLGGMVAAGSGLLLLLGLQAYFLTTRGQTLGKMLLGIKIVTFDDEQNPGFVKAVLLRAFVNWIIGMVPLLGVIYTLADILFIFREDQRCIHDLIAGTKVVKA
jgi:uncharacterized RDD family membrane protein YckC